MCRIPVVVRRMLLSILGVVAASLLSAPVVALSHEEWVMAFVRFVDWPEPAIAADRKLQVCQPADAPTLDLQGKQVRGLTLQVVRVSQPRELAWCQMFVAMSQREAEWLPWLVAMKSRPVLAVGPGARYCELGGTICLIKDEATGAQKYQLNLDSLSHSGFKVHSQLLRTPRPRNASVE